MQPKRHLAAIAVTALAAAFYWFISPAAALGFVAYLLGLVTYDTFESG